MKNITDKEAKALFLKLNRKYFNSRLNSRTKIEFEDNLKDDDGKRLWGIYEQDEAIIFDSKLRSMGDILELIMLHEMNHADNKDGHGIVFKSGIYRLFQEGAYDDLL